MVEGESEIARSLEAIKKRLRHGELMSFLSTGQWKAHYERVLDFIWDRPSMIDRSKSLVSPEDLILLNEKVETIRDWLFSNGADFTTHLDYKEWLEYNYRTVEDCRRFYWYHLGPFQVDAETEPPTSQGIESGYRLSLMVIQEDKEIDITFGFDGKINLEIEFPIMSPASDIIGSIKIDELEDIEKEQFMFRREPPSKLDYRSSRLSLEQMTQEEHRIIQHYLDQFIQQATPSYKR